jgi:hypothetical protein
MGKLLSGINGKLVLIFLAACWTNDTAELPFADAKSAKQAASCAVSLLAENSRYRLTMTERAQRMVRALCSPGIGIGLDSDWHDMVFTVPASGALKKRSAHFGGKYLTAGV